MRSSSTIVPLSKEIREQWFAMRSAINAAAKPFTGQDEFAISVFYLHDLVGAEKELDHAINEISKRDKLKRSWSGVFTMTKEGPACEVRCVMTEGAT